MLTIRAAHKPAAWRPGALLFLGLALLSGCLGSSSEDQTSAELLVVYSGDVRGYYEPCG